MVLQHEEYEEVVASKGLASLYMDASLSRNQKEFAWFLRDMEQRSIIEFGQVLQ